jgi:acyl-CoA thioester hydrolase
MKTVFAHKVDVRFRDCDPLGHVNNAVYFTYLEQARFAHWRSLWNFGPDQAPELPGVILARAEMDYRAQVTYGQVLEVRIGIAALGRTSFTYEYEVVDDTGRLVATARTVLVMFDYKAGKPVAIPDAIRSLLS